MCEPSEIEPCSHKQTPRDNKNRPEVSDLERIIWLIWRDGMGLLMPFFNRTIHKFVRRKGSPRLHAPFLSELFSELFRAALRPISHFVQQFFGSSAMFGIVAPKFSNLTHQSAFLSPSLTHSVVAGYHGVDGSAEKKKNREVTLFHKGDSTPELMKLQGFNCTAVRHD